MSLKMPPFFPIVRPGCEEVAKEFFACYDTNSNPWGSQQAAEAAMVTCKDFQAKYEVCTRASLAKGPPPVMLTEYE